MRARQKILHVRCLIMCRYGIYVNWVANLDVNQPCPDPKSFVNLFFNFNFIHLNPNIVPVSC